MFWDEFMILSAINHDITSEANNLSDVADSRHNFNNELFGFKKMGANN